MFRTARPNLPIFSARAEAPIEPTAAAARIGFRTPAQARGSRMTHRERSLVAGLFQTPLSRRRRSTRLGERCLRHGGCAVGEAQQSGGLDDVAAVENPDELGDRQFGVAIASYEKSGKLGLGRADRLENC